MSIKTNTTSLQDLLERVNALPDTGGGKTIRVEVQNNSASPVYYWDANGTLKNVAATTIEYVDALNGTLHYMQEITTVCNGPPDAIYMSNTVRGVCVAMFLADGCIMTCYGAETGGN